VGEWVLGEEAIVGLQGAVGEELLEAEGLQLQTRLLVLEDLVEETQP
jgi:hypothetical protein